MPYPRYMARPVDPIRYAERRSAIVRAAAAVFATSGYDRATTAGICREAGISSGTFFHYFPSKLDALVAVLAAGNEHVRSTLEAIERDATGLEAVERYAQVAAEETADASFATFVDGIAGVERQPTVAAELAIEAELIAEFLTRQLDAGQRDGSVRRDVSPARLATWVAWLLDGAAQDAAGGGGGEAGIRAAVHALASDRVT